MFKQSSHKDSSEKGWHVLLIFYCYCFCTFTCKVKSEYVPFNINPFTAPACKMSGLKDACEQYIFRSYNIYF